MVPPTMARSAGVEVYHCCKGPPSGLKLPGGLRWPPGAEVVESCGCLYFPQLGEKNCRFKVVIADSLVQPKMRNWAQPWSCIHMCSECELRALRKQQQLYPENVLVATRIEKLTSLKIAYLKEKLQRERGRQSYMSKRLERDAAKRAEADAGKAP